MCVVCLSVFVMKLCVCVFFCVFVDDCVLYSFDGCDDVSDVLYVVVKCVDVYDVGVFGDVLFFFGVLFVLMIDVDVGMEDEYEIFSVNTFEE